MVQFFNGNITQGGLFIVISILILLLRAWSRLNISAGTLTDFFAVIPYRIKKINRISKVIFTAGRVSQTLNSRGSTSTINYTRYRIIIVDGDENIILKEGRNESRLFETARSIANSAHVELEDLT